MVACSTSASASPSPSVTPVSATPVLATTASAPPISASAPIASAADAVGTDGPGRRPRALLPGVAERLAVDVSGTAAGDAVGGARCRDSVISSVACSTRPTSISRPLPSVRKARRLRAACWPSDDALLLSRLEAWRCRMRRVDARSAPNGGAAACNAASCSSMRVPMPAGARLAARDDGSEGGGSSAAGGGNSTAGSDGGAAEERGARDTRGRRGGCAARRRPSPWPAVVRSAPMCAGGRLLGRVSHAPHREADTGLMNVHVAHLHVSPRSGTSVAAVVPGGRLDIS